MLLIKRLKQGWQDIHQVWFSEKTYSNNFNYKWRSCTSPNLVWGKLKIDNWHEKNQIHVLTVSPLQSSFIQTVSFRFSATPLESSSSSLLQKKRMLFSILIISGAREVNVKNYMYQLIDILVVPPENTTVTGWLQWKLLLHHPTNYK